MFERIDAESRWAGFALISGGSLQDTSRMLGDWDLMSTQLRRSVQEGAVRVEALAPDADGTPGRQPIIAEGRGALTLLERGLLRGAVPEDDNWVDRTIHRLVAAPLVGPLLLRGIQPLHVALAAAGLAWGGALAALLGYFWVTAVLLPVGAAAFAIARRMARVWTDHVRNEEMLAAARHGAAFVALALLALHLGRAGNWGWWMMAAVMPLSLGGSLAMQPVARVVDAAVQPRWFPTSDGLVWIAPLLAVLAGWSWMVAALSAYCAGGFLWRLHTLRQAATQKGRE